MTKIIRMRDGTVFVGKAAEEYERAYLDALPYQELVVNEKDLKGLSIDDVNHLFEWENDCG